MAKIIELKEKEVKEFLSNDIVELREFPMKDISECFHKVVIDFTLIRNEVSRQQFRDLLFSIFCYEAPYQRDSDRIYYVLRLTGFMSDLNGITEIPDTELKALFNRYCDENNYYKDCKKIIISCKNALLEMYDTREGFERDTWDSNVFHLSEERANKSDSEYAFHFRQIESVENREYIKQYMEYLIGFD